MNTKGYVIYQIIDNDFKPWGFIDDESYDENEQEYLDMINEWNEKKYYGGNFKFKRVEMF